ncbi:MAG TPA: hypothetical protein VLG69_03165 [Candidatus Andersenbacteria bacterium]|nr:hypothetical protein [Candidatus Andersenbacteria bacterium]
MQTESKNIKETLEPILQVLSDLGGKFTFMDDEGREFVLASRDALEQEHEEMHRNEQQLELPQIDRVADAIRKNIDSGIEDDVIDRINRDIALTAAQEQQDTDDEIDDLAAVVVSDDGIQEDVTVYMRPTPPPPVPKIRFESVRGDLAPELQD